ncbi:hypothetical protein GDO81_011235 [Engystomops pustulosus]|uniref:Uncharacterized protein n=1 Tax=Engystomops pustulosus TaxID=76066 RepID=A0AAV7BCW0_ENGPU|nr:hypothetical protein GDO81_011235 [Engystomops pustulosus]
MFSTRQSKLYDTLLCLKNFFSIQLTSNYHLFCARGCFTLLILQECFTSMVPVSILHLSVVLVSFVGLLSSWVGFIVYDE